MGDTERIEVGDEMTKDYSRIHLALQQPTILTRIFRHVNLLKSKVQLERTCKVFRYLLQTTINSLTTPPLQPLLSRCRIMVVNENTMVHGCVGERACQLYTQRGDGSRSRLITNTLAGVVAHAVIN
jgi:hypothetical protein